KPRLEASVVADEADRANSCGFTVFQELPNAVDVAREAANKKSRSRVLPNQPMLRDRPILVLDSNHRGAHLEERSGQHTGGIESELCSENDGRRAVSGNLNAPSERDQCRSDLLAFAKAGRGVSRAADRPLAACHRTSDRSRSMSGNRRH